MQSVFPAVVRATDVWGASYTGRGIPLSAMGGVSFFSLATGGLPTDHVLGYLPFVIPAALITDAGNSGFIAFAVAISTGRRPARVWTENYRWLAPHYAAHGIASYAMAFSYLHLGLLGLAIFALPVATLWVALKQYAARARSDVARALDMRVVAEGVEPPEQAAVLAAIGCGTARGTTSARRRTRPAYARCSPRRRRRSARAGRAPVRLRRAPPPEPRARSSPSRCRASCPRPSRTRPRPRRAGSGA